MMNIKNILCKNYFKIEKIIAPGLKYSRDIYEEVFKSYINPNVLWLDLGCGRQMLKSWKLQEEIELIGNCKAIVGLDYDFDSIRKHKTIVNRVRGDLSFIPFKNNSFDVVTSNMVVEHLRDPEFFFRDVYSILKPGGIFIFHTPNVFGYTTILARLVPDIIKNKLVEVLYGRKEEDVFPAYYKANSEKEIRKLVKLSGFKLKKIRMIATCAQFFVVLPIAIIELIWIRIIMMKPFRVLRTNMIVVLEKK